MAHKWNMRDKTEQKHIKKGINLEDILN